MHKDVHDSIHYNRKKAKQQTITKLTTIQISQSSRIVLFIINSIKTCLT